MKIEVNSNIREQVVCDSGEEALHPSTSIAVTMPLGQSPILAPFS